MQGHGATVQVCWRLPYWPRMSWELPPVGFLDIHNVDKCGSGWWARATPLKNMSSSIGMMTATQYFWENSKNGNQSPPGIVDDDYRG